MICPNCDKELEESYIDSFNNIPIEKIEFFHCKNCNLCVGKIHPILTDKDFVGYVCWKKDGEINFNKMYDVKKDKGIILGG